ncbi:unnamed protein product [Cylindrotheca closterium]|uniref:Nuclear control of ATPase protein 2 n=1 Tax=Cylindrotheca closterium TaxID=2856 RepID=A0AAD2FWN0_9STRA|nr:unnamed protein product [Cylindrotheca closterium]
MRLLLLLLALLVLVEPITAKIHFPFKKMVSEATTTSHATRAKGNGGIGDSPLKNPIPLLQIPEVVQTMLSQSKNFLSSILLYQPPVGIVAVWSITRLVRSGRLFRLYSAPENSEQALISKASRLDYHTGRALDLDDDDEHYQKFGGVERVRRRLAMRALMTLAEVEDGTSNDGSQIGLSQQLILISLLQVLNVQFPPAGSHGALVQKMSSAFAQVEQAIVPEYGKKRKITSEIDKLMEVAYQTAEVRALDAMLRLARDRLLRSSFRLSRTVQHWKKRVESQSLLPSIVQDFMNDSNESDRMRLAFAEAAYRQEIVRLGKVVSLLTERPIEMDDSVLSKAVKVTLEKQDTAHVAPSWLPKFSNFAVRLNADERGKFQFQHYEESINIGGNTALQLLLEDYDIVQTPWLKEADAWSLKARSILCDLVEDALKKGLHSTIKVDKRLEELHKSWRVRDYTEPSEIPLQWKAMYELVREVHKVRRVGEGKSLKFRDSNLFNHFQQWNLLGIPSTVFKIFIAQMVHQHVFLPYFPKLRKLIQESYDISMEIITTRFWLPVKDLLTELMYRPSSSLLTGITKADEETSLDYMLRDLKFGDGTPATRHDAMIKASRQYEDDMNSGLIFNAMSGRLIRLILIQVQQLKVGMLNAAETIDVLMQTNRFNIQLLAIIPAMVIVTVGTKVFFRFLFTVRVKDLRPMKSVHAEMTGFLDDLESILLHAGDITCKSNNVPAKEFLNDQDLGNFVLTLYNYLVLLDYSSPQPFPSWQCDAIHRAISGFLGPDGTLSNKCLDDQVKLIDQIKRKHNELAKHL